MSDFGDGDFDDWMIGADAAIQQLPAERRNKERLSRLSIEQIDCLASMLMKGDPLADAAVEEVQILGKRGHVLLERGLRFGLASLPDPPPAIAALLRQAETPPVWIEPSALNRLPEAHLSIDPVWFGLAMVSSLLHSYSSPSMARLLVQTGKLTNAAERRLRVTGRWLSTVMLPGNLAVGAPGYVSVMRIRLTHARIRRAALRKDWDVAQFGLPINQVDMARTLLDFSYLPYMVLCKLGFDFTAAEIDYHMHKHWGYLGHLLGVDSVFYERIGTFAEAKNLLAFCEASNKPPDDNSRLLAAALMDACAKSISGIPLPLNEEKIVAAFIRHVHGNEYAEQLGISASGFRHFMPLVARYNKHQRKIERNVPGAWKVMLHLRLRQKKARVHKPETMLF